MNASTILVLTFFLLCVAFVVAFYIGVETSEKFTLSEDLYPKNVNYVSEHTTLLSNGTVQKTLLQDKTYMYEYFYNLPNPFSEFQIVRPGVAFNNKIDKMEYRVFAGKSKDSMEYVGKLTRRGDGYHVLSIKTKEDYKVSCILLDDKLINCVDL
jgi:hypothetical protein